MVKTNSDTQRRKSAPLSVKFDPNTNTRSGAVETETDENVSYNSTLLRMRVVELEQEIETFKQENKKVMNLKKLRQQKERRLRKKRDGSRGTRVYWRNEPRLR